MARLLRLLPFILIAYRWLKRRRAQQAGAHQQGGPTDRPGVPGDGGTGGMHP